MSRSSEQEQSEEAVAASNVRQQAHEEEGRDIERSPQQGDDQQQVANNQAADDQQQRDADDDNKPKRNPFCSRCRNHGKSAQVKGHKRHCEYRDCKCEGCQLVEVRQLVSAAQIKRRREQKQDEECGRKIEISPPVLSSALERDPAALIAKTLIGSSAKHVQLHRSPSKQQLSSVIQRPHQYHNGLAPAPNAFLHQPTNHLSVPASQALPVTSAATLSHHLAINSLNSHQPSISQHMHHHHHSQGSTDHQHPLHLSSPTSASQELAATKTANVNSVALNNALQLFHFPNQVISAAAAAASLGTAASPHQPSLPDGTPVSLPRSGHATVAQHQQASIQLPSIREQINLVEDIHHSYGPLAIYAWLKAEKFDHQKVRDLIDISRSSFNNLMDLKSKYRLDSHNQFANLVTDKPSVDGLPGLARAANGSGGISSSNICSGVSSSSSSSSDSSNGSSRSGSESNIDRDGSSNINVCSHNNPNSISQKSSNNNNNTGIGVDISNLETLNNHCSKFSLSAPPAYTNHGFASDSLPPSPLYTFGSSSSATTNHNGGSNKNIGCVERNDHQHTSHLPSTNTLNSLPIATAQGLFWPGFKMSANAAGAPVLQPHHFLPHFMQHPFGTAAAAAAAAAAAYHSQVNNHRPYINQQQLQQQPQQVSPVDSSVTNSSPSAPSSSAVL